MSVKKINASHIIPVLLSFFVMSFVDLVGTGVDEYKRDADVPQYILQLIPFVAFIWFFLLSVPVGIWQDKIGKKRALNIGILITAIALVVPAFGYSLPIMLITFGLIGIGNTILQVAANPLLVDVVPSEKASSFLSLAQFFKAIGSMIGPFVAAAIGPWIAHLVGDNSPGAWRYGLYVFAVISILSWIWLNSVKIDESKNDQERASLSSCLRLLGNPFVLMMVFGIFVVVGIDVAMNSNIGTFLSEKLGMDNDTAVYGKSVYFFAKMIGTFVGAILLLKINARLFLIISSIIAALALASLTYVSQEMSAWVVIGVVSLGVSNVFPLIFSITAEKLPERRNEISGLMMMAICGGAVIPFLVGYSMSFSLNSGIFLLMACAIYLIVVGLAVKKPQ